MCDVFVRFKVSQRVVCDIWFKVSQMSGVCYEVFKENHTSSVCSAI